MAYRRAIQPLELSKGDNLTRAMSGIGMRFAVEPAMNPNIENTLLAASIEAMEHDDLRVLSVLITWLDIHHPWINADRLIRIVSAEQSLRTRAFWSATAMRLHRDRRFARLTQIYSGPRLDVLTVGTDFQISRKGEDSRFESTPLLVPNDVLRDRSSDILNPSELARIHRTYRQRILMGPTYRADMWAVIESEPTISAAELARRAYGSFATAWQVIHDFKILC
jgi:hypothetical protein